MYFQQVAPALGYIVQAGEPASVRSAETLVQMRLRAAVVHGDKEVSGFVNEGRGGSIVPPGHLSCAGGIPRRRSCVLQFPDFGLAPVDGDPVQGRITVFA